MKASPKKKIALRVVYALILFVTTLSTLEQFTGINEDFLHLNNSLFHVIAVAISLLIACFEAYTMNAMGFIFLLISGKEPVPEVPPENKYEYRALRLDEIPYLYSLAKKLYGARYDFTKDVLASWWVANPNCYFGMFHQGKIVGYLDVFPVDEKGYKHLVSGGDERLLKPQKSDEVDNTSSLYIASFVVDPQHKGKVLLFLEKAFRFYEKKYPIKDWNKIFAFSYSEKGKEWCQFTGLMEMKGSGIWFIDRQTLVCLSKRNHAFWSRMLPVNNN